MTPMEKSYKIGKARNDLLSRLASAINNISYEDWNQLAIRTNDINQRANLLKKFAEEETN